MLNQTGFTEFEIPILKNLALEKIHWKKLLLICSHSV